MTTALEYLKANPVFHIATVDGTKARVRPFGFIMKRNGALYFCTNKTKDVYRQLSQNPEIEISDMGNDSTWLRIRGRIAFDDTREAKVQAFKESASSFVNYRNNCIKNPPSEVQRGTECRDGQQATFYLFSLYPFSPRLCTILAIIRRLRGKQKAESDI